jgi:flavin reductase (DIM6/NTAB) family NADH-FMN oxidoreductase RutF
MRTGQARSLATAYINRDSVVTISETEAMNPGAAATVFGRTDRELWLVTAQAGSRRSGLIATFVSQASIVPDLPRVLVGLAKQHYTWDIIEASGAFALHLLGERLVEWVWQFGLSSGRDGDKFLGLEVRQGATKSPLLDDALGWLDCKVEATLDTGDRAVCLAEVIDGQVKGDEPPLTLKQLLQLAPADKRDEMKRQMQQDAAVDAAAIRAWRQRLKRSDP